MEAAASKERRRRLRFGTFPRPSDLVEVPYAKAREVHAEASPGVLTRRIIDGPAWQEVIVPILDAIDERRDPRSEYTAHELESALLFQRVAGKRGYKQARGLLAGDMHADARSLLGFDRPRGNRGHRARRRTRMEGVPSEATLSRWRTKFFPAEVRATAYGLLLERMRRDVAPLLGNSSRMLYLDGTTMQTHYTAPKIDDETGEVVNSARVTAPDAGYVPPSAGPDHSGNGWNIVVAMTEDGVPLAHKVVPLHFNESETAVEVLADLMREMEPFLPDEGPRVLTADGAFATPPLRRAARAAGCIENVHRVSHADSLKSEKNRRKHANMRFGIEGYPNWHANGFREVACACGEGSITRRAKRDTDGVAQVSTEGSCKTCGSITITSGRWRQAKNPNRYVRIIPGETPDLQFGNPLTFNDPMAEVYGKRRRGHQEGAFGHTLTRRFGHVRGKRWYRRMAEAEADTNVVFSIMLALAADHYAARETQPLGVEPPGPPEQQLPLAA